MKIINSNEAKQLYQDAADLGRMKGLEGHARAAELRLKKTNAS